ncbi:MAG: hypothetical protein VZS44_06310 [Bacilli bacterium]|nr:hypothetical protein [Bacilli bacterium]
MKGNKKILVVALLVLLIAVSFTTYAIYRTGISGTGSATAAGWNIVFKRGSDTVSNNFTFNGSHVTWTNNPSAVAGKIAPGASGYIEYTIDATGSEVDVLYEVALGTNATPGIDVTIKDSTGTNTLTGEQTLQYASSNMAVTFRIYITWEGSNGDSTTKDTTDMGLQSSDISIPITITAKQSLANHAG